MYSVRLLLRCFPKEGLSVDHRFAHSWKSRPQERFDHHPAKSTKSKQKGQFTKDRNQLTGNRRQVKSFGFRCTDEQLSEIEKLEDEEFNASLADSLHDAHYSEMRRKANSHALAEYGQKFYKPKKEPALLSWEDMEKIRSLRIKEEWPLSSLARSFPANEAIIEKVCKSTYRLSLQDQFKHDERVAENWILLRKGKLDISDELREHCLNFTNRRVRPMTERDIAIINQKPVRKPGSFLNLIKPPDNEEMEVPQDNKRIGRDDRDFSKPKSILEDLRKRITLEEARKRELEHIADSGFDHDEETRSFVVGTGASKDMSSQESEVEYTNPNSYTEQSVRTRVKTNEFVSKWDSSGRSIHAAKEAMNAPIDDYPEKITIPETAKKPGAIYRVDDCFYNEEGEFMYRVPGLKV